jgi:hypothetical protein
MIEVFTHWNWSEFFYVLLVVFGMIGWTVGVRLR